MLIQVSIISQFDYGNNLFSVVFQKKNESFLNNIYKIVHMFKK